MDKARLEFIAKEIVRQLERAAKEGTGYGEFSVRVTLQNHEPTRLIFGSETSCTMKELEAKAS